MMAADGSSSAPSTLAIVSSSSQDNKTSPSLQASSPLPPLLPKLTIDKLKSYIKPIDRNSNHEIPLPTELEPYFGKGWYCRYYHSTPAWGFIPPKGSGIRRADGFKALMSRLELMEYRKSNSSSANKNQEVVAVAKPRTIKIEPIHSNRVQVPPLEMQQHHVVHHSRSSSKENMPSTDNSSMMTTSLPEPYTPYFIYFLLENMRLLQINYPHIPLCNAANNNTLHNDPQEHPRPLKYQSLHLPPYWYSSSHRSNLEFIMKRLSLISGHVDILSRWHVESNEVRGYCERLAGVDHGRVVVEKNGKRRRREEECTTSSSPKTTKNTIHIDHEGITIKKPRMVSVEDVAGISTRSEDLTVVVGHEDVRSNDIFKTCSADENSPRSLPHQVTFESKPSVDEGSVTGGPPKKRFLNAAVEQDCGIGLLAHVASLL
eukprot:scaffold92252_cov71-Cyclotella_meneghiniana.AAC.4